MVEIIKMVKVGINQTAIHVYKLIYFSLGVFLLILLHISSKVKRDRFMDKKHQIF